MTHYVERLVVGAVSRFDHARSVVYSSCTLACKRFPRARAPPAHSSPCTSARRATCLRLVFFFFFFFVRLFLVAVSVVSFRLCDEAACWRGRRDAWPSSSARRGQWVAHQHQHATSSSCTQVPSTCRAVGVLGLGRPCSFEAVCTSKPPFQAIMDRQGINDQIKTCHASTFFSSFFRPGEISPKDFTLKHAPFQTVSIFSPNFTI